MGLLAADETLCCTLLVFCARTPSEVAGLGADLSASVPVGPLNQEPPDLLGDGPPVGECPCAEIGREKLTDPVLP